MPLFGITKMTRYPSLCSKNVYEQHRANYDASQIRTIYGLIMTPGEVGHVEVLHELASNLWYREANNLKIEISSISKKDPIFMFH